MCYVTPMRDKRDTSIGIRLTPGERDALGEMIDQGEFETVSQAVRAAIRHFIKWHQMERGKDSD